MTRALVPSVRGRGTTLVGKVKSKIIVSESWDNTRSLEVTTSRSRGMPFRGAKLIARLSMCQLRLDFILFGKSVRRIGSSAIHHVRSSYGPMLRARTTVCQPFETPPAGAEDIVIAIALVEHVNSLNDRIRTDPTIVGEATKRHKEAHKKRRRKGLDRLREYNA